MRKALLFISLFASAIVLNAQIDVLYQGSVVTDTIVIYEQSPNEECYIYLTCKNNQSNPINVKVVSNRVYGSEEMEILSVCAVGETCVPGTESRPFDIAANGEKEFDSWVMINEGLTPLKSAEELYATCDVVSLHIPATPETKGSINYALLKNMPKGGLLVNTARKEVINEDELIKFMQERADFRYVTDVMPAADQKMHELFEGRYFSTPKKMGAQTAEANINAGIAAARQIVDFFVNGVTKFQVNK
jgi:hypothetical protein